MDRLILGSQSPRRKEILSYFNLPFEQHTSFFDEEAVPFKGDPQQYVCTIASGKSEALAHLFPDAIILTADTTVYLDGEIYNKPSTEEEAFQSLSKLVGKWHHVYSGVSLRYKNQEYRESEETKVLFNALNPEQIRHYHSKIHWADKAGSYAIQMGAGLIVNKIDGCYYNVMGLPINTVRRLLNKIGIELWDYVK